MHLLPNVFGIGEHPFGAGQKSFTCRGQCDVPPGTMKKLGTELGFEGGNLPTQGGLGDMQLRGCLGEMPGLGHHEEAA